jgi:hypothetical protein
LAQGRIEERTRDFLSVLSVSAWDSLSRRDDNAIENSTRQKIL